MDPNETYRLYITALKEGRTSHAETHCHELIDWLSKGGAAPDWETAFEQAMREMHELGSVVVTDAVAIGCAVTVDTEGMAMNRQPEHLMIEALQRTLTRVEKERDEFEALVEANEGRVKKIVDEGLVNNADRLAGALRAGLHLRGGDACRVASWYDDAVQLLRELGYDS